MAKPSNCPRQRKPPDQHLHDAGNTRPGQWHLLSRRPARRVCLACQLAACKNPASRPRSPSAFGARGATFDFDIEKSIGEDIGDEVVASAHTPDLRPRSSTFCATRLGGELKRRTERIRICSAAWERRSTSRGPKIRVHSPRARSEFALTPTTSENGRASNTSQTDEQTLHEIYGRHFEIDHPRRQRRAASWRRPIQVQSTDDGPTRPRTRRRRIVPELLTDMFCTTLRFSGLAVIYPTGGHCRETTRACSAQPAAQALYSSAAINAGLDTVNAAPGTTTSPSFQNDRCKVTRSRPRMNPDRGDPYRHQAVRSSIP